ncbi:hypothetical protein F2Q69_00047786 [Brassica cretica]|uniref:Secreted protein n=1 Tax=Brassica cretica TaxID=69181 RepID=A0A8S9PJA8_BRACR|nr:hypothetical protein F2Q69_00047786 [Brassica cretica]
MTSAFLRGFHGFSFFFASLGLLFQSTSGVHNRLLLPPLTRSCGLLTARVISTASSLRRPVSGVSGGSAASCSGDDSPVVVSMVWSTRVSRSLRVQHVLRVVDRVINSIGLF